jgi:hypothetical protein
MGIDTPQPPAATAPPQAGLPGQAASDAVSQAQAPASAPAQTPATSSPAQSAPAQGTTPTPSTTQSGLPGAPTADPTAIATAHPTSILRGALMGILGAASKVGKGVEKVGEATGAGQSIRRSMDAHTAAVTQNQGAIAKQGQEAQASKDAAQKAQDEHIAAGDTHSEMPLRMNILSNTNVGLALSNHLQGENLSQTQIENRTKNNAEAAQIVQLLKDEGVPLQDEHGVGFDNLGANHAADIVGGKSVALNNGQTGENHGIVMVALDQAEKTPLTKDRQVATDYKVDPKTGVLEPVYSTLHAGTNTVMDILNAQYAASQKFAEKSKIADSIQKANTAAADAAAKKSEVGKNNAEGNKFNAEANQANAGAAALGGQTTEHTASQLVEGNEDPSQLTKRSKNYDATLAAADDYSMKHYGVHFSPAQASIDYKFATTPATQNTLKYLNSLTGADNRSGNLQQLIDQSTAIKRTQFPALNNTEAWVRLQAGDPQMAAYYATVTEVADQVAKIMQGGGTGGGTSDAKIKQASELFDKGFNKDQITAIGQQLRQLLANRKKELIGGNRYLVKQFPQTVAPNGTKSIADGSDGVKHYLGPNNEDLGVVGYGVK